MDKFKTVLNFANEQSYLGYGIVTLLTFGGEKIFSIVVFSCPCNHLNFLYGFVFLLVPALALLLVGYILSKKTWKLFTGFCLYKAKLCRWKRMVATLIAFTQITTTALVAPLSWIAFALLNGRYFECAMSGTNLNIYSKRLCGDKDSLINCQEELYKFPCGGGTTVTQADRDEVRLTLRAQSQVGALEYLSLSLSLFVCGSPADPKQTRRYMLTYKSNAFLVIFSFPSALHYKSALIRFNANVPNSDF